jgi:hypothetical protein
MEVVTSSSDTSWTCGFSLGLGTCEGVSQENLYTHNSGKEEEVFNGKLAMRLLLVSSTLGLLGYCDFLLDCELEATHHSVAYHLP